MSDPVSVDRAREVEDRAFSGTWGVPADRLAAAVDDRYPLVWRAYDVRD